MYKPIVRPKILSFSYTHCRCFQTCYLGTCCRMCTFIVLSYVRYCRWPPPRTPLSFDCITGEGQAKMRNLWLLCMNPGQRRLSGCLCKVFPLRRCLRTRITSAAEAHVTLRNLISLMPSQSFRRRRTSRFVRSLNLRRRKLQWPQNFRQRKQRAPCGHLHMSISTLPGALSG